MASSIAQLSRRILSMASSLSPGSRVPVLHEQGWWAGRSLAHTGAVPTPITYFASPGPRGTPTCVPHFLS